MSLWATKPVTAPSPVSGRVRRNVQPANVGWPCFRATRFWQKITRDWQEKAGEASFAATKRMRVACGSRVGRDAQSATQRRARGVGCCKPAARVLAARSRPVTRLSGGSERQTRTQQAKGLAPRLGEWRGASARHFMLRARGPTGDVLCVASRVHAINQTSLVCYVNCSRNNYPALSSSQHNDSIASRGLLVAGDLTRLSLA